MTAKEAAALKTVEDVARREAESLPEDSGWADALSYLADRLERKAEVRGCVYVTAEERNALWQLAANAYYGAMESLSNVHWAGDVDFDDATRASQWLGALEVLGCARTGEEGCEIPLSLPMIYVLDAAEKEGLEILGDGSKTTAAAFERMSSAALGEMFLPPARGDTEAETITALIHVKAIRERMEDAEPGLRRGGTRGEES